MEGMGVNALIDSRFWKGKKVFVTGHTGFKGGWLSLWLKMLGAEVKGYSLQPPTEINFFTESRVSNALVSHQGDISDSETLLKSMNEFQPDIVMHLAAQSLVRLSYDEPVHTYQTNVMGTINVFEAARKQQSVKAIVNVTTDKCYENKEWVWGYREDDPMGGHDPYSNSKGCVELVSQSYRKSFMQEAGIALATARAGNVIGGGDWAKDRIVPDAVKSFIAKKPLEIRNPASIRPWQHVLEPLSGYLLLVEKLYTEPSKYSEGWNFGPSSEDAQPVSVLADIMVHSWGDSAQWITDSMDHPHEATYLKLDCSKAHNVLGWKSAWNLQRALEETIEWYKAWNAGQNMNAYSLRQIEQYQMDIGIK